MGTTEHTDGGLGRQGGPARALGAVLAAGVLAAVALLFLGIVVAFGPDGFGGDGTPTHAQHLRASIGEWAGMSALALALVALVVAALVRAPVRDRLLLAVVGGEAVAVVVLIGSTFG